jgi:glycosyltransferase EpsE
MGTPAISVLMGVYYRRTDCKLLERSISSILNQSQNDLELLVCDDGSTQDAVKWLETAAKADSRLKLVRRGNLFSLPAKLNACLEEARGQWIARMDDDDYAHPQRLERQVAFLEEHREVAFVGSCVSLWRDGEIVGRRDLPEYPQVRDFYMTQPFIHPSLVFRREALEAVGGYSEEPRCLLCEDYDLLLRLYQAGYRGANLPEILLDYTVPLTAKGGRRMGHRWNETVTRWRRFRDLGLLPRALPFVVKPLAVGLLPERVLRRLKER